MNISENFVDFSLSESRKGLYCVIEYTKDNVIALDRAITISVHKAAYERMGVKKFVIVLNNGVVFTKESKEFFGRPGELENMKYIAVYVEDTKKWANNLLNFFHKFKNNPTTRYFGSFGACIFWIEQQTVN